MKNCFLVMFLAVILSAMAAAQKTNSTQAIELPQQTPIFSPAELSAKVPPPRMARRRPRLESLPVDLPSAGEIHTGGQGAGWRSIRNFVERG
jgi:hypothetical protein